MVSEQEVQKAWAIGDTAKEKEAAAQKVILQLKEEVLNLRAIVNDLNKYVRRRAETMISFQRFQPSRKYLIITPHCVIRTVSKLSQDAEGPQRARVDNREQIDADGSTPFERYVGTPAFTMLA